MHVFSTDEYGEPTPELLRCKDATMLAFVVGAIYGGVGRSRVAYMEFFRSNAHTAFETPLDARRQLQDKVMLGFGSGSWRVGWRTGVFTAMFTMASTLIAAYRGKSAILDQMGGGATAGFLYKFREGPKSMVAGTLVGAALGCTTGILALGMTRMTGLSIDEFIQMQYAERLEKRLAILEERRLAMRPAEAGRISLEELQNIFKEEAEAEAESQKLLNDSLTRVEGSKQNGESQTLTSSS